MGANVYHTLEQKGSHCVLIEVQKQPQCTCQAETVSETSLTPSIALLVHPRDIVYSIVDCYELIRSQK